MLHREASEATSGRKMKVMLIFPPDWFPSEPYLSLPSLTAVLRQAGHTVIQKDINLEMYDWYFSEDFLKKVLHRVPRQLDRLRKLSKKRDLNAEEMDLQLSLCDLTRQRIDELIKKAEKAKAIIRGEVFYEIDQLEWAIHVFREVTSVISMVYAPARICMPPMETDLSYKVFVSSEVMDAVNDTQVNVYRDVFEHLVKPVIEQEQPDVVGISIVLAAADVLLHDLLRPHQAALPPHSCDDRRQHGDAPARCAACSRRCSNTSTVRWSMKGRRRLCSWCRRWGRSGAWLMCPTPSIRTKPACMCRRRVLRKIWRPCRRRISTGCRSINISCRRRSCPIWRRGAAIGAAASSATMARAIRPATGRRRFRTFWPTSRICVTSTARRHFHFTDESYPPALFRKLSRGLIDSQMGIVWTTHMRFEKSLLEDQVWQDAKDSGCRYLHFGYESGNERVLKLMDKATTTEIMTKHLQFSAECRHLEPLHGLLRLSRRNERGSLVVGGISRANKDHVHSLGFGTFDLGRHNPVAKHPEKWGVTAYKNPEWDLALDYYYTVKDGMSIEEAERVFQEFERNHNPGLGPAALHP